MPARGNTKPPQIVVTGGGSPVRKIPYGMRLAIVPGTMEVPWLSRRMRGR